jgi:lipopolysaccharide export system protein LptA
MRLSGQSILATFYPPPAPVAGRGAGAGGAKQSETAQVKSIVATGPAHCVIRDEKEPEKQIDADTLTITTLLDSAGKPYPDSINATGHAHAVEMSADGMAAAQDIFSKQMDITLSPPPAKASLQKFLATGDVTATRVNGDRIKGDGLSEEIVDGEQVIHLWGSPPAQVIGSNGTLSGRELELKPKEQWAKVTGPGTIDCSKESDPKKPAQPMHVAWSQGAELKGDLINVNGDVSAETTDPTTGQASRATGDHAVLELVEVAAPATTPATVPAAAKAAADGDVDMLGNKQVKTVTLTDNATMTSTRLGADGLIVQRAFIEGSTIYTEVKEQRLKVPGKGRMLLEDHAPVAAGATTGPSHQPTTGGTHQPTTDQSVMGGHGATAFSWANGFLFDQGTRHCDITGAVVIRHLSDANKADWTTVTADKVTADFEPVDGAATKPAEGLDQSQMKLKRLGATGSVVIQTGGATVNASVVDYDPATELMTAIGSVDDPVTVTSQQGRRDGSFQQAVIDTRTNKIVRMLDFTGKSR